MSQAHYSADSKDASSSQSYYEQPAPVPSSSKTKTSFYSFTSLACLLALGYLAFESSLDFHLSPSTAQHNATSVHHAAESPSANFLPVSVDSHTGPSCHVLPNVHSDHFSTSVCCDLKLTDGTPSATLWMVRNASMDRSEEDFRIKAHGLAEKGRTGRKIGSSKLDRPVLELDGYSYRYDFSIPTRPTSNAEMETFVAPTLNVWFQTTSPIVDPSSNAPKRYTRLFDEPIDLSSLECARPSSMPLAMRFMRH